MTSRRLILLMTRFFMGSPFGESVFHILSGGPYRQAVTPSVEPLYTDGGLKVMIKF